MQIKPFPALVPASGKAVAVAAVPYDVLNTAEARTLAAGNPDSLLHVSRPEIDLADTVDIHDDEVYEQGLRAFHDLQQRGVLVREAEPSLYAYRQCMGGRSQTGIIACSHADDYENNVIRKHEKTRQDKEDDRARHTMTLRANTGPVFLTYRDRDEINAAVTQVTSGEPAVDFTAADGVRHTVWRISDDTDKWCAMFADVPLAYIADGHHRAASGWRAARECRAANPEHNGSEEYNWFLTVLFPASHLSIMPYNRVVVDLNGRSEAEFIRVLGEVMEVTEGGDGTPTKPRQAHMYLGGKWYTLSWPPFEAGPVERLDVSVLQERVLAPLLAIDDPRTSRRVDFVGGIRGTGELVRLVDSGAAAVAFSLYPVTVDDMMDIADANQVMPPKSTWFEPKLRSGLAIHTF
ncbi:MAG: DUF1015 domain-containing protein [Lentisphaerae bacterium]|jgi:uncharacterized protein (DUF1015 family)|nr:DUF1015 domain-containing protein [Lentisphaerota bacterium]